MPSKTNRSVLPLLHIDDNPDDRCLLEQAIRRSNTRFEFHGANGLDAAREHFSFLPRLSGPQSRPRPALVLLDYHLGDQCGTDFLYWLRILHGNTAIPVVMYTDTAEDGHIQECYANGANHFLRKPASFHRTTIVVHALAVCFSLRRPSFHFLASLPESEPDPRLSEPALA